ncbi:MULTISPECIES: prolipoprotein diacylglyceryl transferase [Paenibacillus]|uniref:Phosphatidylglycerol--prolipoprotein diacylglyceryl transferase n=2 Tax=Paenibacillus TaxID=44249 RepID=A0A5J5FR80_9BACL|nr:MULTISPECIES: prolipoprotein diacylglyceryl transferase [Paenibacillus]KAA8995298.1 prolipoprotein diacylglyceryl transferase [Paenibacillus spiritus]SDJ05216.1 phosphatidylglycerol:prolipoprotein diacylglycerol transferase [Paenibacillus typhae]
MRVILFEVGGLSIRSYGVIVGLAVLLAIGVAYYLARGTNYQKHILNLVFYVIFSAIIGARIWHVFFFQWGYYSKHLGEIFAIWNGGISIQGALIGGFIAVAYYARKEKISFWGLADILAPAIIFGQAVGRIACFLNGDAFGAPTGTGFGIVYPEGTIAFERYGSVPLWPAEIWEGQLDLIVFGILLVLKNIKLPKGGQFLSYNIMYALVRFSMEFLRGDSPRYALGWTAGQWTSMSILVISLSVFLYFFTRNQVKETVHRV